jgi:hypothetical protein
MAAAAQTRLPHWPSALRLHRGERLRYVYDFGAHVNMDVDRPGCIELRVWEQVRSDRLTTTEADGYVTSSRGATRARCHLAAAGGGAVSLSQAGQYAAPRPVGRRPDGQHEQRRGDGELALPIRRILLGWRHQPSAL